MTELAFIDVFGAWIGIFLTFCILSFLYKDNPFYKAAEHVFIGVSIGYVITQQYYNVLRPKLVERLGSADYWYVLDVIPLILVCLLFVKAISRRWSWVGRYPLAFVVALYAGLQINGVAQADLGQQIKRATESVDVVQVNVNEADEDELASLPGVTPSIARKVVAYRTANGELDSVGEIAEIPELTDTERTIIADSRGDVKGLDAQASVQSGDRYWFGIVSNVLLLLGLLASLVYFYFSVAHTGVIGKVSRFGVWVLMIGFGASFGYTVQGRISLAIGRAQDILGHKLDEQTAERIQGPTVALISIAIIVAGIVFWELANRRKSASTDEE